MWGVGEVSEISPWAEGTLGDKFYDFFYEVEKIVVGGAKKIQIPMSTGTSSSPSIIKRPRYDQSSSREGLTR